MNYVIGAIIGAVLLIGGFFWLNTYIYDEKQGGALDPMNATYIIDGQPITLVNGAREQTTGSDTRQIVMWKVTTHYFGNDAKGDLNNDGIPDTAFILTQTSGGSGTFFYAVVALQNAAGRYIGTNGVLLGDRIAPQTTEIRDGVLTVNYADRRPEEPFSAQPSVGVSAYFTAEGNQLVPRLD